MDARSRLFYIQQRNAIIAERLESEMITDAICRRNRLRMYHGIPWDRDDLLPPVDEIREKYLERISDSFDLQYRIGKYHPDKMSDWQYRQAKRAHQPLEPGWVDGRPETWDHYGLGEPQTTAPTAQEKDSAEAIERDLFSTWDDGTTPADLDAEFEQMKAEYQKLTGEEL